MSYDQEGNTQIDTVIDEETFSTRPTFLTVLCIITFIVSGFNVMSNLVGLFSSESFDSDEWEEVSVQVSEAMDGADSATQDLMAGLMESVESTIQAGIENAMVLGLISFLASALSFFGAFQMFKLKKMGYYIYILSKVIGVFLPLMILGVNLITGIIYGLGGFLAVLFIILYGTNRKHLA